MFHGGGFGGGGGPGGPGGPHGRLHGAQDIDEQEELGKLYDSKVVARLPKYLIPVKSGISINYNLEVKK